MVMGVQTSKAGPLLADADGGTPWRFLWFPTYDWDAPEDLPDCAEPKIQLSWPGDDDPAYLSAEEQWNPRRRRMRVCDTARKEMLKERQRRNWRMPADHPPHHLFIQLKMAAAISIIRGDGREVTEDDWSRAGLAMRVSDWQRAEVEGASRQKAHEQTVAQGMADGTRVSVSEEIVHVKRVKRVGELILRNLEKLGPMDAAEIKREVLNSRDYDYLDEALDLLLNTRKAVLLDDGKYKPA